MCLDNGALTIKTYGHNSSATGTYRANQSSGSTLTLPQIRYQDISGKPTIPTIPTYTGANGVDVTDTTISGIDATTSVKGVVQLINSVTNTSNTRAATANSVKQAYDRVATYAPKKDCLLYTSPSPRDRQKSRMPSSA